MHIPILCRRQRVAGRPETEDRFTAGSAVSAVGAKRRGLGLIHLHSEQQTRTFGQDDHHGGRDR